MEAVEGADVDGCIGVEVTANTVDIDGCNGVEGAANIEGTVCTSAGALSCFTMSLMLVVTTGTVRLALTS